MVMCLSIGTPKINKFSIVPNGKLIIFRCPKFWANYSLTIIGLNIGHLQTIDFPFGTNGKSIILSVPTHKYFRVIQEPSSLGNSIPEKPWVCGSSP